VHTLFAERFVVDVDDEANEQARYDDDRNFNVTATGIPYFEAHTVAPTNTFTAVNAEPSDADRSAWESLLGVGVGVGVGVGTRRHAKCGRDFW